jgi:hypothetical protein
LTTDTICWRRLDAPGHDACRLEPFEGGWRLDGAAVFLEDGQPARLAYRLTCDAGWRARAGVVSGWIGDRDVDVRIERTTGGLWTLAGAEVPGLEACLDLDFGFTPATNLTQLRRIGLAVGQAADVPVAWLDVAAGTIEVLPQRYERRATDVYGYEAPRFGYAADLHVRPSGFVRRYPGLWEEQHLTSK